MEKSLLQFQELEGEEAIWRKVADGDIPVVFSQHIERRY